MYPVIVVLLMLVLPLGSVVIEHARASAPLILLVGKWFVFWSVGVRLLLAGLRQFFQPSFTAREIFAIENDEVLPLIRELGVANFASGVVGVVSLAQPSFVLPVAVSATIFYGVAGMRHVVAAHRTRNESIAMISDLFIAAILGVVVVRAVI